MKPPKEMMRLLSTITVLLLLGGIPAVALSSEAPATPVSTPTLNEVLGQARKSVGNFWSQFKSVTCIEKVAQEKLGKQDKVEYTRKSMYDYLVLASVQKDEISVEESRLEQGKSGQAKNIPLMVANGLPMLLLVFHPYYEPDFRYELGGDELVDGHKLIKIRFQHVAGMRSTTALRLRGKDNPLDLQGTAYIDPETGAIHRIVGGIAGPMSDFHLKALDMDVQYTPHEFAPEKSVYWLPSTAVINIQTEYQHWRNTHQYSNYKRFTVATEEKIQK